MTLPLFENNEIGTTGTQRGGTQGQLQRAERFLLDHFAHGFRTFRHGDCIGWDEQAHGLALSIGYEIIIHPPINPTKRAFCKGAKLVMQPKDYLPRNHDIVDAVCKMIAAPAQVQEQMMYSGTWATVRYTRKRGKELYLITP